MAKSEFTQIFEPVQASVAIDKLREIQDLLNCLNLRERSIIDDIGDVSACLGHYLYKISASENDPEEHEALQKQLVDFVDEKVAYLKERRDEIDEFSEKIIREMCR